MYNLITIWYMKSFTTFYFENFSFDPNTQRAYFGYSFDREEFFTEEIDFSSQYYSLRKDIDTSLLQSLLFHCHIALGISYYKLFPTQKLTILSGNIDQWQAIFWKKFYLNGLGEFFITNDIDPTELLNFESESCVTYPAVSYPSGNRVLLPWGGWKDSIVSSILLQDSKRYFTPYVFWKIDTIKSQTLTSLWENVLQIQRTLCKNLFKMNTAWYYNGHVPITWIIAFISFVTAYLYKYRYIILSNESSADEWNTTWKWLSINHQYSKSFEFEKDLQWYAQKYITSDTQYFSILRGFHEYKIAEIFSHRAQQYFTTFSSCNKNFTLNSRPKHSGNWCWECEKCCFVYLMLSAFLTPEEWEHIFWENLFKNSSLLSTFSALIGYQSHKPFECVGTYEESIYALYQAGKKYDAQNMPLILKKLFPIVIAKIETKWISYFEKKLGKISNDDIIPADLKHTIPLLSTYHEA